MKLSEYQDAQVKTATYPGQGSNNGFLYAVNDLTAAVGEVAGDTNSLIRDGVTPRTQDDLRAAAARALWAVSAVATELGASLEDLAEEDLDARRRAK